MKRRNAQNLLLELVESGELLIGRQAGPMTPHGPTNLYTVVTPGAIPRAGVQGSTPHARQYTPGVQSSVVRGAPQYADGVHHNAPKPSVKPSREPSEGESARANPPDPSPPPSDNESLGSIYAEVFNRTLTAPELAYIAARVTDPDHWRETCDDWKVSRYRATNLPGLVDRYSKPRDAPTAPAGRDSPRRGPPVGEPVHETEAQIKIRCAARKAELLKGFPSWA